MTYDKWLDAAAKRAGSAHAEDVIDGRPYCARCGYVDQGEPDKEFHPEFYEDAEIYVIGAGKLRCKFCGKLGPEKDAHLHDGGWVGECCWDDRLKATE